MSWATSKGQLDKVLTRLQNEYMVVSTEVDGDNQVINIKGIKCAHDLVDDVDFIECEGGKGLLIKVNKCVNCNSIFSKK